MTAAVHDLAISAVRPAPRRTTTQMLRTWYKLLIPCAIGILILVLTYTAHAVQSVDLSDPDYLNPTSSAPHGGLTLATALRAHGVSVQRVTSTADAFDLVTGSTEPATLLIPAAGFLTPTYAESLAELPAGTRVVFVAPGGRDLYYTLINAFPRTVRWAPRAAAPGCSLPDAVQAGTATVDGLEYDQDGASNVCYDGGLVDFERPPVAEILVGASDPFRNDRIHEHGNEALALGLLSHNPSVVWLDIHTRPKPPKATSTPPPAQDSGPHFTLPELFPPWLWAGIGMILLAGILYAAAAARRLGPPISEPLPVAARINETIEGRGRLYRRTKDRSSVLRIMQAAAVERIRAALRLTPAAAPADIVSATAGYLRVPPDHVGAVLYGGEPADDTDLRAAVASLDALTAMFAVGEEHDTDPAAHRGES